MPYYHPGYEYQTPVQWMSINNRRFMVACLHEPAWNDLCEREFEKSLSLGASGILYDEAFHHYAATHCFSANHGHRIPATMASGDLVLGQTLQELLRQRHRSNFLLAAEAPFDLQHQHYALSYFRIFDGHIPAERYADPFYPIMIAVTGFDDREMINRALLRAVVLINDDRTTAHEAKVELERASSLRCASPESPELQPCDTQVVVPARSAVVVFG
jgi:hypothetical protein